MKNWFEKYPDRFQKELEFLKRSGYDYEIDLKAKAAGLIQLTIEKNFEDNRYKFLVVFPESYPYFVCSVICEDFPAGRHKNPYSGHLCTLKNPYTRWETETTLAEHLDMQVPVLLQAHRQPNGSEAIEANEAAQVTGQIQYGEGAVVLVDGFVIPPETSCGTLVIGLYHSINPQLPLRGCLLKVLDKSGNVIASANDILTKRFESKTVRARWVRLPSPPKHVDNKLILSEAEALFPSIADLKLHDGIDVVGLLFPEEIEYKNIQDNWIFIVRLAQKLKQQPTQITDYVARSDRADIKTLQARIPNLAPIAKKRVLIVGLGSIGSMCAWQLARAGIGGLNLIDFDHLQLGNIPRWMLGMSIAGQQKTRLLGQFLKNEYIYLDVKEFPMRIGEPRLGESIRMAGAISGVDAIIDATAEWCISHYLSSLAMDNGIAYVWVTGTVGSQGGTVGRIVPGETGCWKCFQRYMYDKTYSTPPSSQLPEVQPVGCFHPAFTGTGFDMDLVSIQAIRLAIATLCRNHDEGYPDFDWDVGILSSWDKDKPIAPTWEIHKHKRHPDCDC